MRCSATVVLPEPAVPRITTTPLVGRVISVELLGVDQPGDVGQMLVGALGGRARASVPRRRWPPLAGAVRAQRRAFAAGEPRRFALS